MQAISKTDKHVLRISFPLCRPVCLRSVAHLKSGSTMHDALLTETRTLLWSRTIQHGILPCCENLGHCLLWHRHVFDTH